jgi:hypothetical protein
MNLQNEYNGQRPQVYITLHKMEYRHELKHRSVAWEASTDKFLRTSCRIQPLNLARVGTQLH